MKKKYYLGLDQGTTGTTALLFDTKWNQVSKGYSKVVQYYPKPGWVEHDGLQLYDTLLRATDEALRTIGSRSSILGFLCKRYDDWNSSGSSGNNRDHGPWNGLFGNGIEP